MDELRAGLAQGGLAALPTVTNILGDDRLDATRRDDGKWDLTGTASPVRVFHAPAGFVKVGPSQKLTVKGHVAGVVMTNLVTPPPVPAPAAGTAPAAASPQPAPVAPGASLAAPAASPLR